MSQILFFITVSVKLLYICCLSDKQDFPIHIKQMVI